MLSEQGQCYYQYYRALSTGISRSKYRMATKKMKISLTMFTP